MDAKDRRIAELDAENVTLKKHSGNSSKPPSSDIVKPPKLRKDKSRRRKIGAQKGHQQHLRQPFDANQSETPNEPTAQPASWSPPQDGTRLLQLSIENEMKNSYLTYAMSVIVSRAIPDVRDGLKPSQRRILVAMNDLNLSPGASRTKCAKICGSDA